MLAKWLYARNRPADSERVYQMVLEREPAHRGALITLARIALIRRDPAAAAQRVRALLAVETGRDARRLAIEERILAGDLAAATALADHLVDATRATFDVELALSDALARGGRVDEARRRLDRVARWDLDREARIALHEARAAVEHAAGNEHQARWELEQRDRLRIP
jgi:hypothetical protein